MTTRNLAILAGLALAGCGMPPNQRLLTRTDTYEKAMSFGFDTGHPLDLAKLERRFPELKGIVITAPQWIDEYEQLQKEAKAQDKPIYPYRIPFGANLTIEVTGEPELTRNYTVPPTGFVYYPYISKLRVYDLSVEDLKGNLESRLAVYLKEPEVLIHINRTTYQPTVTQPFFQQSFGGAEIIVMGVARTAFFSSIAFTGKETLVSVLGQTNLPSNTEWRQIRIIRRHKDDPLRRSRIIVCDLWNYFAKGDVRQDIPLMPGDVIFVPPRWSTDDQFWTDWEYVKRILGDVLFLDDFRKTINR